MGGDNHTCVKEMSARNTGMHISRHDPNIKKYNVFEKKWKSIRKTRVVDPMLYQPFAGTVVNTSESDVCRCQILTYKDGPRTARIKIFLMAVDPIHRYSNEAERANLDSCDDSEWSRRWTGSIAYHWIDVLNVLYTLNR